jgi:hypothetical protein
MSKEKPNKSEQEQGQNKPEEIGGVNGPEPTTYGDWQHKGRVTDF